ncbi:MFS transporter [Kitasatospora sp. NPDC048540]|uniref:MFS transporter n=1 Tax=unclassified Kitasatospora TaxID=2633591 RepID=UPI00068BBE50|nr:MFS transporter [Kitasatospora sp. MBT63]
MHTSTTGPAGLLALPARLLHPEPVVRRLSVIVFVNTLGSGLSMTLGVLWFTRMLGFGAAQVGLGLTAAGLCGVLAGVPAGRASDRWGARPVLIVLVCVQALGTAGYTLIHGYALFVPLACVVAAADRGATAVRAALYADVLPPDDRVACRAYLRSVTNVGIALGACLAALVLEADTRSAYLAALITDAASFAVVAVLFAVLVPDRPRAAADGRPAGRTGGPNPALRNLPYLAVTALNGVLTLQFAMLEVGVPLWVVQQTEAPRAMVAGSMLVNTVLVIALQVRATRSVDRPSAAARAFRRGGLLVACSCVVLALAHGLPAAVAALLVVAGVALQALGEVLGQAGTWSLGYDLAADGAHGAHQGVFNTGQAAAMMLGPALVTWLLIGHGLLGWLLLGTLFAAGALAMGPTVRWAERRPAPVVAA